MTIPAPITTNKRSFTMKNTITLSELANKRDIFIDYSAVFNTHFVNMMIEQARPLHDAQKQITVHRSVLNELTKLAENGSIGDSTIAKERIAQLNALNSAGVVNYIGNSLEPRSSNQQYIELMVTYRNKKDLAFISDNDAFIADIELQNKISSFPGNQITVFKYDENGNLVEDACEMQDIHESDDKIKSTESGDKVDRLMSMFGLN